jgi:hypothetical protein
MLVVIHNYIITLLIVIIKMLIVYLRHNDVQFNISGRTWQCPELVATSGSIRFDFWLVHNLLTSVISICNRKKKRFNGLVQATQKTPFWESVVLQQSNKARCRWNLKMQDSCFTVAGADSTKHFPANLPIVNVFVLLIRGLKRVLGEQNST